MFPHAQTPVCQRNHFAETCGLSPNSATGDFCHRLLGLPHSGYHGDVMLNKSVILSCLLMGSTGSALRAQSIIATVGVPYSFDIGAGIGAIVAQAQAAGLGLTVTFSATGNLPPGITLAPS